MSPKKIVILIIGIFLLMILFVLIMLFSFILHLKNKEKKMKKNFLPISNYFFNDLFEQIKRIYELSKTDLTIYQFYCDIDTDFENLKKIQIDITNKYNYYFNLNKEKWSLKNKTINNFFVLEKQFQQLKTSVKQRCYDILKNINNLNKEYEVYSKYFVVYDNFWKDNKELFVSIDEKLSSLNKDIIFYLDKYSDLFSLSYQEQFDYLEKCKIDIILFVNLLKYYKGLDYFINKELNSKIDKLKLDVADSLNQGIKLNLAIIENKITHIEVLKKEIDNYLNNYEIQKSLELSKEILEDFENVNNHLFVENNSLKKFEVAIILLEEISVYFDEQYKDLKKHLNFLNKLPFVNLVNENAKSHYDLLNKKIKELLDKSKKTEEYFSSKVNKIIELISEYKSLIKLCNMIINFLISGTKNKKILHYFEIQSMNQHMDNWLNILIKENIEYSSLIDTQKFLENKINFQNDLIFKKTNEEFLELKNKYNLAKKELINTIVINFWINYTMKYFALESLSNSKIVLLFEKIEKYKNNNKFKEALNVLYDNREILIIKKNKG